MQKERMPSSRMRAVTVWPTLFLGKIWNEERLLRLPHQSGGSLVNGLFMATHDIGRNIRLNVVELHHVARRIVERQGDKIDMDYPWKALREIMH